MNSALGGVPGWRVTETDRQQHELVALRDEDVQPRDGLNVVLTIDAAMQHIVETALADAMEKHTPISITGIVMRPRTGEILAMATLPDFDPNKPGTITRRCTPQPRHQRRDGARLNIQNRRGFRRVERRRGATERHV